MLSRLGVTFSALLVVTALVAPGAGAHDGVTTAPGQAHDVNTPAGHQAEDTVVHTAATEAVLDNGTRLRSAGASLATAEVVVASPGKSGNGARLPLARRGHSCSAASERQGARV